MNKLGLYFGAEKREALLRGDISSTVVDRYFVHSFQTIGMYLCRDPESPAVVRLQARYAQIAWEYLIEISKAGNPGLRAQGLLLFVHALIIMGFTLSAQSCLSKACEVIEEANLKFLPVYGCHPKLSEQIREDTAVLSQAIHLENYFHLTLGGPVPAVTARIVGEFLRDLQVRIIPWVFVVGLEMDLVIRSSECIRPCLTYAR